MEGKKRMTRRSFFISSAAALSALSLSGAQARGKESTRPNVVLIYVDDLGYKDLSCYGSTYHETPNIDALMASGLRFTQAYSNAPLCAPSRIALLTGRHCARAGCYEVSPGRFDEVGFLLRVGADPKSFDANWRDKVDFEEPHNTLDLPKERRILPEYFKELGYFTGFFGKWHVGPQNPGDRGFDDYVSFQGQHLELEKSVMGPRSPEYPEPKGSEGDYLFDCSMRFVDRAGDRPFFLYLPYYFVHGPIQADEKIIEKYKAKKPSLHHGNPVYAAMIEMLDTSVGKLVESLRKRNLLDNTVIVFTSDNGAWTGHRTKQPELDGYEQGDVTSHYPLRGGKIDLFEGGIRIPMSISYGDRVKKGTFDAPVTQLDILPTLLDVIGHPDFEKVRDELDGQTLRPILEDPGKEMAERTLYWHYPGYRGMTFIPAFEGQTCGYYQRPASAIRRGDWKLHESLETGSVQLYNLREDIGETTNVAEEHPELVNALKADLKAWRKDTNAPMPKRKVKSAGI